jgi:transglutaminase-like putative cysteine protease
MHYQITHTTIYSYSQPITLEPHIVRLRPRSDSWQTLRNFVLDVSPVPAGQSQNIDLDGNALIKLWFAPDVTDQLQIQARSQIETHCTNPFNYLLESWAAKLPIDYPASMRSQLQPYLSGYWTSAGIDPIAMQLAQEIYHAVGGETVAFLTQLNQRIYQTCKYMLRETGAPLTPGVTWTEKSGSCRDLAVLFMEVCRAIGLAARFVSGYQAGDPNKPERHLHAWTEVYLPGAGWRGYDSTNGVAVADSHFALVASALPKSAAPITGGFKGRARSQLAYQLSIQPVALQSQIQSQIQSQSQSQIQ